MFGVWTRFCSFNFCAGPFGPTMRVVSSLFFFCWPLSFFKLSSFFTRLSVCFGLFSNSHKTNYSRSFLRPNESCDRVSSVYFGTGEATFVGVFVISFKVLKVPLVSCLFTGTFAMSLFACCPMCGIFRVGFTTSLMSCLTSLRPS